MNLLFRDLWFFLNSIPNSFSRDSSTLTLVLILPVILFTSSPEAHCLIFALYGILTGGYLQRQKLQWTNWLVPGLRGSQFKLIIGMILIICTAYILKTIVSGSELNFMTVLIPLSLTFLFSLLQDWTKSFWFMMLAPLFYLFWLTEPVALTQLFLGEFLSNFIAVVFSVGIFIHSKNLYFKHEETNVNSITRAEISVWNAKSMPVSLNLGNHPSQAAAASLALQGIRSLSGFVVILIAVGIAVFEFTLKTLGTGTAIYPIVPFFIIFMLIPFISDLRAIDYTWLSSSAKNKTSFLLSQALMLNLKSMATSLAIFAYSWLRVDIQANLVQALFELTGIVLLLVSLKQFRVKPSWALQTAGLYIMTIIYFDGLSLLMISTSVWSLSLWCYVTGRSFLDGRLATPEIRSV